ncbi:MAG TPA: DUF6249 domain-containing protein [Wenzhouxiangella sp.]
MSNLGILIPIFGLLAGVVITLAAFIWQYKESKNKQETIKNIAQHINDPDKIQDLLNILEERKKEPLDYRRGGVITLSVGVGLYLFGLVALGSVLKGVGLLVGLIGIGTLIAGYLYPNTSAELTNAVEQYEKRD